MNTFLYEWICSKSRFDTEVKGNSEVFEFDDLNGWSRGGRQFEDEFKRQFSSTLV